MRRDFVYNERMIENLNDFLSVGVLVLLSVSGLYILYVAGVKHSEMVMRRVESRYYRYFDNADDESTDDSDETYYEET